MAGGKQAIFKLSRLQQFFSGLSYIKSVADISFEMILCCMYVCLCVCVWSSVSVCLCVV